MSCPPSERSRGFEKRVAAKAQIIEVVTPVGWRDVVVLDVAKILANNFVPQKFEPSIEVTASNRVRVQNLGFRNAWEVTLRCRTASEIYWVLAEGECSSFLDLKKLVRSIPWSELFAPNEVTGLDVSTEASRLDHRQAIQKTFLNELDGQIRVGPEETQRQIRIRIEENFCSILLPVFAQPLYKRGYKAQQKATAPLPESTAACLLAWHALESGKIDCPVYVPFAGSGTFAFEMVLQHFDLPSTLFRAPELSTDSPLIPKPTINHCEKRLFDLARQAKPLKIHVSDIDPAVVSVLKSNLASFQRETSKLELPLEFTVSQADFFEMELESNSSPSLFLNPPFGIRLDADSSPEADYLRLGRRLEILSKNRPLNGVLLCPDELTWKAANRLMQNFVRKTHHFSLGGLHLRAVSFTK